ncbi:metallophosphoesterase [Pirellulaceae bacterium SH449]
MSKNPKDTFSCWFISDTHNRHRELNVPKGVDVVIHCGDESGSGDPWRNATEARSFFHWYTSLDIPIKLFTPGNHSTAIEQGLITPAEYPEVQFLIHEQTVVNGLVIFGTPYTPEFYDWAYMRAREDLDAVWQSIPDNVDILITHGPPKGILDVTHDFDTRELIHVGSGSLTRHVKQRIKPLVHAFGHIHDERGVRNFGMVQESGVTFVNCSCCNIGNKLVNHGLVLEINLSSRTVL